MKLRLVMWVVWLACVAGCSTNTYYREASVGLVDCEEGDMAITGADDFATRSWTVTCPNKKKYNCKGIKGNATCTAVEDP